MTVTLEEAASQLESLVKEAATGEEITITDGEIPLAKIVAAQAPKRQPRQPGSARGMIWMAPDFDAPLEDFKDYM